MLGFRGKTAIVTGAGSGIGFALAEACAAAGMAVAACDIQASRLDGVVQAIEAKGGRALPVPLDVSDRLAMERAAVEIEAAFGNIHYLFNNAGIAMHGVPIERLSVPEWDWVIDVNIYGVIHGMQVFLPFIRRHGEGGHVINTASIGGFQIRPGWNTGAYSMTKYAVVALSEALEQDLEGTGIGVSVLCPALVETDLATSGDNRPARFGGPYRRPENDFVAEHSRGALKPSLVAARVLEAVKSGEFFIFTHSHPQIWIEERHRRLLDAFDRVRKWEQDVGGVPVPAPAEGA
jgi:NAD(P)-dependent dehydrogenase (short-subunit alcohol dehydrogenase family)